MDVTAALVEKVNVVSLGKLVLLVNMENRVKMVQRVNQVRSAHLADKEIRVLQ